ncbi:multifunctional CCA addition/repair protein [Alteromonadaceae bacterium M269]|nr:multifunctional CCA addition/repair protein [Alteromonadaceae bacterium M269]
MQIYLVGGAVRDELLGRPVKDKDWVVVGATLQDLLDLDYQQVGNDFPVFLHPKTKDEYALARTERKQGQGYNGFICDFSSDITLEQDLIRRDLTVNAIAKDTDGNIFDPFHGQKDIEDKVLRHVSPAFEEDPLRVFRVARFAARYASIGFSIAPETMELMTKISNSGELESLTAERIWKETSRAILEQSPQIYFEVLKQCGALGYWFSEIDKLWGVPNPPKWHPEIDTGVHSLMVLEQAALLSDKLTIRFASLVHDLGKALTSPEKWPSHHGHEKLGVDAVKNLCDRVKVPNDCRDLALLVSEYHTHIHHAFELKPKTILKVFHACDAWRKPERFEELLTSCIADARGRTGFETCEYPQADYIRKTLDAALSVDIKSIVARGLKGGQIKEELDRQRLEKIAEVKEKREKSQ